MQYVSIDIETTGLDRNCQIIEFAAVIDDLSEPVPIKNLPVFHTYVTHEVYSGEPYALAMHAEKFKRIAEPRKFPEYKFTKNEFLAGAFGDWLALNGFSRDRGGRVKLTAAGKNFASFDLQFINKLPRFDDNLNITSRCIDVGPMYLTAKDKQIPALEECIKRAGLDKAEVTHDGLNEAIIVAQLIRHKLLASQ